MTHLGLGSLLEEPWGAYWEVEVGLSPQEVVLTSWEDWVELHLGGCLLPCLNDLVGILT